MRQCYPACKYSAENEGDILLNIRTALVFATTLLDKGWWPVVPVVSMSHETDWPTAMLKDKLLLRELNVRRDAIIMRPGWETSKGANLEKQWAEEMGLPVLLYEEALHVE